MKKILIVGMLALGTMTFANSHENQKGHKRNTRHEECVMKNMEGNNFNKSMSGKKRIKSKEEIKNNIEIQEKKIAIKKLMLNENIEWNQIEKINLEIAQLHAKNKTEMMKLRHTALNMPPVEANKIQN